MTLDPSSAFKANAQGPFQRSGNEPCLGGILREKAVWVDESTCIGCTYCGSVATNTFVMEEFFGRARAIRQDGDSSDVIQEAIDTCPVDCIHWVKFEELDELRNKLDQMELQSLGLPPKITKKIKPRED